MSPCMIRRLTSEGLQPVHYRAVSLDDAISHETKDGVYTVANTFDIYKTLKFGSHLDRLEDSAQRANIALSLDRERLKAALRQMIREANFGSVRFRITVSRHEPDSILLSIEPFTPISPELITSGVRVITIPNGARQNAVAKTTNWMHARQKIADSLDEHTYDAILLNKQGDLLEGLGANFYAIMKGQLYTADEEILLGISRQIVLEVAPEHLPVRGKAINILHIPQIQEAFITNSSRGIVPVIQINHTVIGDGRPGSVTKQLRLSYDAWVTSHLKDL